MSVYRFRQFELDSERLLLLQSGRPLALGPKIVETLLAFLERPNELLTKAMLLDRIWPHSDVNESNLAQNVYVLRKMLREHGYSGVIQTVPCRGYRFSLPVSTGERSTPTRRHFRPWPFAAAFALLLLAGLFARGWALLVPMPSHDGLSTEAARLYEIGYYNWNLRTSAGTQKSLAYFTRVVALDPQSSRGYAALAAADAVMADYGYGTAPPQIYAARATAFARRAIAIDPNCSQAYAVLGMVASEENYTPSQVDRALRDLRRAVALDPSNATAHEWYGTALLHAGRFARAYSELRTSASLDPLSVATVDWLSHASYLQHRYGEAVSHAREALDLAPWRTSAYETLGLAYQAHGDNVRALAAFESLSAGCAMCRPQAAALMAALYAGEHRMGSARAQLAIARAHDDEVAPEDLALALAAVGQKALASAYLNRLPAGYRRAEMASDPRFHALRRRTA